MVRVLIENVDLQRLLVHKSLLAMRARQILETPRLFEHHSANIQIVNRTMQYVTRRGKY